MPTFTTDSTNTYVTIPPPLHMEFTFLLYPDTQPDPKLTGQLWPRGNW